MTIGGCPTQSLRMLPLLLAQASLLPVPLPVRVVSGQLPVAEALPANTPWWVPVLLSFFGILSTVITTVLLPALRRWLEAKRAAEDAAGKRSLLTTVALKAEHYAEIVHAEIDATMKPSIEEKLKDGKLDDAEKAELRAEALALFKKIAGTAGLAELSSVMGLAGEGLDRFINGLVEKQVDKANALAASIAAKPANPS